MHDHCSGQFQFYRCTEHGRSCDTNDRLEHVTTKRDVRISILQRPVTIDVVHDPPYTRWCRTTQPH